MTERGNRKATVVGLAAIGLWSGLALSTVGAADIPPFELLALSFGIAFTSGMLILVFRGRQALEKLRQPGRVWIIAFVAIFSYHALYFFALASVPPARASLIAYLWPLLIVLFAALIPGGDRLHARHVAGAALGFTGAAAIFLDPDGETSEVANSLGYLAAFGCAVIWSGYSVTNRRFAHVPSEMLIGVCGAVAATGAIMHLVIEDSTWPSSSQWLAILFIGIGPTGIAFLAWDYATKHGNVPLLGALSYLAPLISTLLLIVTGQAPASIFIGLAALLIVGGAALASYQRTPKAKGAMQVKIPLGSAVRNETPVLNKFE